MMSRTDPKVLKALQLPLFQELGDIKLKVVTLFRVEKDYFFFIIIVTCGPVAELVCVCSTMVIAQVCESDSDLASSAVTGCILFT